MIVTSFNNTWKYTRQMTNDFISVVPDEHWNFSPNGKYGPLCQQFKHMVQVSEVYNHAIKNRSMDFSVKGSAYSGALTRENILLALKEKDQDLVEILATLKGKEGDYQIKAFGSDLNLSEFLHIVLQHESLHHGLWSFYANLADFELPASWKDDWRL